MIHPAILCGGSGTRLWPSSRKAYPKQFAPLLGAESIFQMTLARFAAPMFAAPLVVTGDDFRFLATDQALAAGLSDPRVIVEPEGRDTAAAVLTAALLLAEEDPEAVMLVAPSDHVIADVPAFHAAIETAAAEARKGALVTFGVTPDRQVIAYCNTGYRSAHAYVALAMLGYPRVRNYVGSWQEWANRAECPVVVPDAGARVAPV